MNDKEHKRKLTLDDIIADVESAIEWSRVNCQDKCTEEIKGILSLLLSFKEESEHDG